jgi:amidophosphoribosyltransferase
MPAEQSTRNLIAHMKLVPVQDLIYGKDLLFVDDSIVRGTQMRETVDFLYRSGANQVHIRSASPPIIYGCKYLNFSRSSSEMELITRSIIQDTEGKEGMDHLSEYADPETERAKNMVCGICKKLKFSSLGYLKVKDLVSSIGLPEDNICTYCFTGKE